MSITRLKELAGNPVTRAAKWPWEIPNSDGSSSKWSPLPAFPDWPYVMTDDDIAHWSDIVYMRQLVDMIADECETQGATVRVPWMPPWHWDVWRPFWHPTDRAAEMLADWRAEIDGITT
jgi:hypothetical protein